MRREAAGKGERGEGRKGRGKRRTGEPARDRLCSVAIG
jgi:hypothetical protein